MTTNEFQITDRAVDALSNAIDDIQVSADIDGTELTAEDIARGALVAVAEDGWELVCHNKLLIEDGKASLDPNNEFNVIDHFAKRVEAHGD
jgi:hypothetical protein